MDVKRSFEVIRPPDEMAMQAALARQDVLTKPPGSLGRLEELSVQLAGITRSCPPPRPARKAVIVFAGDHGVVAQGVSAYPQEVTPQMVLNFLHGGAAINVLARQAGASVVVVDAGVAAPLGADERLVQGKIASGTADMTTGPAMTPAQAEAALALGRRVAEGLIDEGLDLLACGEMGIGNTTPATAIIAAVTGRPPIEVVGPGTGLPAAALAHKAAVVERALALNRPDPSDGLDLLAKVGGFEIGAIAGAMLAAAARGIPVVVDGFIATAAAIIAETLAPGARAVHDRRPPFGRAGARRRPGLPRLDPAARPRHAAGRRHGRGPGHAPGRSRSLPARRDGDLRRGRRERAGGLMADFLRALSLLTVLPVRARWEEGTRPGRAMAAYPLTGALIGAALALSAQLLSRALPAGPDALLPAVLVLAIWVLLTGGLHLDGWADCCDALFVPASRERRLEILHDPRLGSFGGIGLALLLLLKLAAIRALLAPSGQGGRIPGLGFPLAAGPLPGWMVLLVAPVVARWTLVLAARAYPPARPQGMAVTFRQGLGRRELAFATLTAAIACIPLGPAGLVLWAVSAAVMYGLARLAMSRLGGLTGDVYGATVELAESAVLLAACFLI